MSTEAEIEAAARALVRDSGRAVGHQPSEIEVTNRLGPGVRAEAHAVLAAVEPLIRERLAQQVEALETHYDYVSGSHKARIIKHPSQIRAEAMSIVRGDAS
ncbi:hypothetical protein [Aeromicrobium sp.]|uniref:hypothetical protein n=1 Tax=Aeromicrobium sp. TaxID=1871063 RepID=UPI002FC59006